MTALRASFFILATILVVSIASAAGAPKRKKRCRAARAFGPIKNGRPCKRLDLECRPNKPACSGSFDADTETCTDLYLPCTCSKATSGGGNKTWSCPTAKCAAPDEKCTCANPALVGPGQACYKEGLVCPNDEGIVTCYGVWDAATEGCTNVTVTPDCDCYQGEWVCAFADCAAPDPRCT